MHIFWENMKGKYSGANFSFSACLTGASLLCVFLWESLFLSNILENIRAKIFSGEFFCEQIQER